MLYIIRHGKTEWNEKRKIQGRTDIELNEEGRKMTRDAAEQYKDIHFDVCFSSPLKRAKETAETLLSGRDVPIFFDDRLKEMSFGDYEGVEKSFDKPDCPINLIFKRPEEYVESIGGSETFDELFARTGEFLKEKALPLVREGKDVLIVGHGAMNLSIISQVTKQTIDKYWAPGIVNCQLVTLNVEDDYPNLGKVMRQ